MWRVCNLYCRVGRRANSFMMQRIVVMSRTMFDKKVYRIYTFMLQVLPEICYNKEQGVCLAGWRQKQADMKEVFMNFNPNSGFLFVIAAIVIVFVVAQSVFFLVRAYRHGIEIGMDKTKLKKTVVSTAVFTVAPAISILLGILTLAKFLGIPLPWIRLSVVGAITYELPAATSTATALGLSLSETITDPKAYSAIAWVMTLGIIPGMILIPLFLKKIQGGIMKIKNKDSKWGDLFMTSLFLGMISAFLGMVFTDVRSGLAGWIPIFVLLFSALVMGICGLLIKVLKWQWLETYAMSISMILAMIFAVIITPIIG